MPGCSCGHRLLSTGAPVQEHVAIWINRLVSFLPSITTALLPLETLPAISSRGRGLPVPLRRATLCDLGEINAPNRQQRQRRRTGRWGVSLETLFSGEIPAVLPQEEKE